MHRYLVFCGDTGDTRGGAHDAVGGFRSIEPAKELFDELCDIHDWVHVFDVMEMEIVLEK